MAIMGESQCLRLFCNLAHILKISDWLDGCILFPELNSLHMPKAAEQQSTGHAHDDWCDLKVLYSALSHEQQDDRWCAPCSG